MTATTAPSIVDSVLCGSGVCPCAASARRGSGSVHCPAHTDNTPSLNVSEQEGKTLVRCHGGCAQEAVIGALKERGLWQGNGDAPPLSAAVRRVDTAHPYFRLPEVLAVAQQGRRVYVVEGEKDADCLTDIGLCATTSPGGAGKWRDEYAEALRGAEVIIIADKDSAGRNHARSVAASCNGEARSIKLIELPGDSVNDSADWLATGGTAAELTALADAAPRSALIAGAKADMTGSDSATVNYNILGTLTWQQLKQLSTTEPPTPIVDRLIAEGERVLVYGFTNVGKSIFSRELAIAVQRGRPFLGHFATTRRNVGVIDEESSAPRLGEQLIRAARGHGLMDAPDCDFPLFAVRQRARLDTLEGASAIADWVAKNDIRVLIVDSLIRVHRLRENDAEAMARIDEATRELQARALWPLTIVLLHHAPKPREMGSTDAITMARGSSDLVGSADSAIYLRRGKERGQVIVDHAKARWTEPMPPFLARLEADDESLRMVYTERGKAARCGERVVDEALAELIKERKATNTKQGRVAIYSLTESGMRA